MIRKLPIVRSSRSGRMAPFRAAPVNNSHSNDNRPGFRRPADQRLRPRPAMVCHWIEVDGRMECRWTVCADSGASQNDAEPPPPSGPFTSSRRCGRQAA